MPVYRFPRLFSFALTAAVTLRRGGPLELVLTWGSPSRSPTVAGCAGDSAVDRIAPCLSSAADQQIASAEFPLLLSGNPQRRLQVRVTRLSVRHKFLDLSLIPGRLFGANVPSTSEITPEHLNSSARPVMTTDHRDHPRCRASCGRPLPTARRRRSVPRFQPDRSSNPPR